MATMPYEGFIVKYFMQVPATIRSTVYLLIVIVSLYRGLLPEFINGEIRIESVSGDYVFYTLGRVSLTIEGKDIITDTNSRGKWSPSSKKNL